MLRVSLQCNRTIVYFLLWIVFTWLLFSSTPGITLQLPKETRVFDMCTLSLTWKEMQVNVDNWPVCPATSGRIVFSTMQSLTRVSNSWSWNALDRVFQGLSCVTLTIHSSKCSTAEVNLHTGPLKRHFRCRKFIRWDKWNPVASVLPCNLQFQIPLASGSNARLQVLLPTGVSESDVSHHYPLVLLM